MPDLLLDVKNLHMYFPITSGLLKKTVGYVKAVDNVSLTLKEGETLGVVGESGCGKSTLGRTIIRIYQPISGQIIFHGRDIAQLSGKELKRSKQQIQMVFQDPYASLNPMLRIDEIVAEPLFANRICDRTVAYQKGHELLLRVGLSESDFRKFPHQFSGGQRQRVCIARALALSPRMIIADEAVSALDVSIQSQILNLMMDLKQELQLSYIFISHNLAVVNHICDRVMVMYLGNVMEFATRRELFWHPRHPYTQALISAAPDIKRNPERSVILLEGEVPNAAAPPSGCLFHTRCLKAAEVCKLKKPDLVDIGGNHKIACHLYS